MSPHIIRILKQVSESLDRTSSNIQVVLAPVASVTSAAAARAAAAAAAEAKRLAAEAAAAAPAFPMSGGGGGPGFREGLPSQETVSVEQPVQSSSGAFLPADELFPIDEGKPRGMTPDDTNRVSRFGRNFAKSVTRWFLGDNNYELLNNLRNYVISIKRWRSNDETKILFTYRQPPRDDDSDLTRMVQRMEIVCDYLDKYQTQTNWDVFNKMMSDYLNWYVHNKTVDLENWRRKFVNDSFRIKKKNGVPHEMEKVDNQPLVPPARSDELLKIRSFAHETRAMRKKRGPKYYTYAVQSGFPDSEIDGMLERMEKVATFVLENWSEKNDKVIQGKYRVFLEFSGTDGVGLAVREVPAGQADDSNKDYDIVGVNMSVKDGQTSASQQTEPDLVAQREPAKNDDDGDQFRDYKLPDGTVPPANPFVEGAVEEDTGPPSGPLPNNII